MTSVQHAISPSQMYELPVADGMREAIMAALVGKLNNTPPC